MDLMGAGRWNPFYLALSVHPARPCLIKAERFYREACCFFSGWAGMVPLWGESFFW